MFHMQLNILLEWVDLHELSIRKFILQKKYTIFEVSSAVNYR